MREELYYIHYGWGIPSLQKSRGWEISKSLEKKSEKEKWSVSDSDGVIKTKSVEWINKDPDTCKKKKNVKK